MNKKKKVITLGLSSIVIAGIAILFFSKNIVQQRHSIPFEQTPEVFNCKDCNIILISLDTLRYDKIGNNSPFINSLKNNSIYFSNAYANSFFTTPSHMTLFTGTYPLTHKVNGFQSVESFNKRSLLDKTPINDNIKTIAEMLAAKNYSTYWSAPEDFLYLSPKLGFYKGFQHIFPPLFDRDGLSYKKSDKSKELLKKLSQNKFFLFLHSYDNHSPYLPLNLILKEDAQKNLNERMSDTGLDFFYPYTEKKGHEKMQYCFYPQQKRCYSEVVNFDSFIHAIGKWMHQGLNKRFNLAEAEEKTRMKTYINDVYDQSVQIMDNQLKEIFDEFDAHHLLDNTVVIIVSDHGTELFDKGGLSHRDFYQHNIRIPFIVYSKNKTKGFLSPKKVSLVQVAPTITEILGLHPAEQFQSGSIFDKDDEGNVFGYSLGNSYYIKNNFKYILNWNGEEALFNLDKDPNEQINLLQNDLKEHESILFDMKTDYQKWLNMQQYY